MGWDGAHQHLGAFLSGSAIPIAQWQWRRTASWPSCCSCVPIDYPWHQAGYSLSYLGHSTRHETWPNPPFQAARAHSIRARPVPSSPGDGGAFLPTCRTVYGNATSLGRSGRRRFEHTMGASTCEYPALTEGDHVVSCHRYLVDMHMQTWGLHRSLRRHFSGVPRGTGLSLSSRTSPGLSDSPSERAAVFPALLGLSQGSLRVLSGHPSPHQTKLGEQPVSSPSPLADPQKPHGKHQGCMLRRDPSPQAKRSRPEGVYFIFFFFIPPCPVSSRPADNFYTSPKVACTPCTKSQTAPPTAPSFPLCRVRPFSWGRSRPGRDFHFSPCFLRSS